jgi:CHAT domain-containing protein
VPPVASSRGWTPRGRLDGKGRVWLLAFAASLVALVWPLQRPSTPFHDLVIAAGDVPRSVEGRLTGGFTYTPMAVPARAGSAPPSPGWRVLAAAARAQDAASADPSAANLHALGVAALSAGSHDIAVQALLDAAVANARSASIQSDLAAAYLARGVTPGHAIDLPRAVEAARRAITLGPRLLEPRFNYALALEHLHLPHEAGRAWDAYLARAGRESGWADEARRRRDALAAPEPSAPMSPASEAEGLLRQWVRRATADPATAWMPDLSRHGPFYLALAGPIASMSNDERRQMAGTLADLLAAEDALASPDYATADRLAASAQARVPDVDSPLSLWAERIRLTTGFNTGHGVDVRQRADRLAETASRLGFQALESDARHRLGATDYVAGRYERAADGFEQALRLRQQLRNARAAASSRLALGDALQRLGRDPEAWNLYLEKLRGDAAGDVSLRYTQLFAVARVGVAAGFFETAVVAAREAEHGARTLGHAGLLTTALYLRARALVRLGDLSAAAAALADSRQALDEQADPSIRERYLADLAEADAEWMSAAHAPEAVAHAAEARRRLQATNAWQRLLGLSVVEAKAARAQGDLAAARAALAAGIALVEAQQRQIASGDYLPSFVDASWDVYSELVDLEATSSGGDLALTWLDRGFDVRHRWHRGTSLSLEDLSRRGPVVAYLTRPDAVWIWVVVRGAVHQRRVPVSSAVLARHVARLAHAMTLDAGSPFITAAAAALAEHIWWPVADLLDVGGEAPRRVALVLDPVLQGVPFSLLPWSRDGSVSIVDRTATVLCPSLSACAWPSAGPPAPLARVAVLHAGRGGEGFAALPAARDEAERTGRRYAGATVETASAQTFRTALATADLVHFSGHAAPDERYPGRSSLLLEDDDGHGRRVSIRTLLEGQVRATLVVLSACRTSRAEARRGEGGTGVAGEFLRAGVRDVIAAHFDVKDDVSSAAMQHVHDALASGAEPWDAVRLAQQRVRATTGTHPRDWAGYVAFTSTPFRIAVPSTVAPAADRIQRSRP